MIWIRIANRSAMTLRLAIIYQIFINSAIDRDFLFTEFLWGAQSQNCMLCGNKETWVHKWLHIFSRLIWAESKWRRLDKHRDSDVIYFIGFSDYGVDYLIDLIEDYIQMLQTIHCNRVDVHTQLELMDHFLVSCAPQLRENPGNFSTLVSCQYQLVYRVYIYEVLS